MLWIPASIIAGRGHVSDARRFLTALGPASEFACAARAVPLGVTAVAWIFEDRDRDQRRSVVHRTTLRFAYIIVSCLFACCDGETAPQTNRTPDGGKGLW